MFRVNFLALFSAHNTRFIDQQPSAQQPTVLISVNVQCLYKSQNWHSLCRQFLSRSRNSPLPQNHNIHYLNYKCQPLTVSWASSNHSALTSTTWVRSQASSCETCGGQNSNGTEFSPKYFGSLPPVSPLHRFTHTHTHIFHSYSDCTASSSTRLQTEKTQLIWDPY